MSYYGYTNNNLGFVLDFGGYFDTDEFKNSIKDSFSSWETNLTVEEKQAINEDTRKLQEAASIPYDPLYKDVPEIVYETTSLPIVTKEPVIPDYPVKEPVRPYKPVVEPVFDTNLPKTNEPTFQTMSLPVVTKAPVQTATNTVTAESKAAPPIPPEKETWIKGLENWQTAAIGGGGVLLLGGIVYLATSSDKKKKY